VSCSVRTVGSEDTWQMFVTFRGPSMSSAMGLIKQSTNGIMHDVVKLMKKLIHLD